VPVREGDTLEDVEARANELCAEALADAVAAVAAGRELAREPQGEPTTLFRRPGPGERARCARLVAEGEALRLYREAGGA